MTKRTSEEARMLQELLDTAADMRSSYGVMSKTDMARIRALCEAPPSFTQSALWPSAQ